MRREGSSLEVYTLLARLEETIQKAGRIPLTGKVMVDADDLLALVDAVRDALPEEVRAAAAAVSQRDQILEQTRAEAEEIVRNAKQYAQQLTDEVAVTREAKEQAEQTIDRAKAVSRQIRGGAMEYAEDVLARVGQVLKNMEAEVHRSREELQRWDSAPR